MNQQYRRNNECLFPLTGAWIVIGLKAMKMKIFAVMAFGALLLAGVGCVSTVSGTKTAGVPFVKDSVEGNYARTVEQVTEAAKAVIQANGTLVNESKQYQQTNEVRTVEGKVSGRRVWVRVTAREASVSQVLVQTRNSAGGTDIGLAHELEKQIALQLVK